MADTPPTLPSRTTEELLAIAALFRAAGAKSRFRVVVLLLVEGEMDTGSIARALGLSQPDASSRLRDLLRHRLVCRRADGSHRRYRLSAGAVELLDAAERMVAHAPTREVPR